MKLLKKLTYGVAISMAISSGLSCTYASENSKGQNINQVMKDFNYGFGVKVNSTTPQNYYYNPQISNVHVTTIDSKLCVVAYVQAYTSIADVQIDGKTATRRSGNNTNSAGEYYIEASGTKSYSIYARDVNGRNSSTSTYLTVSDTTKPTVNLAKIYKNGYCYLEIRASDNNSISSVKVDGSSITFSSNGGTETYKVTQSKTYTVEVKDAAGNTTTEKIDINIDNDKPSLTVDKNLKEGKWYLSIKASPASGTRITKVTVNNSQINFSSSGETKEYLASSSGNYTVVVTDSNNQQTTQTVNVDYTESTKPTLTAVAKDMGGIMGIDISAYPSNQLANNGIKQVTVNGMLVSIPNAGGKTDYMVTASGTYTVVATDAYGNSSTQTVAVVVPTAQSSAVTGQGTETSGGSSKAVFKINQKSYNLNGAIDTMEGAPVLRSGRTMLPTRYVAYAVNIAPSQIKWDKTTKEVTINDGNNVIKLKLNSKKMTVNGVEHTMDVPATMINNLVYIPISQIKTAFQGVSVNWNKNTKEVTVTRN